MKIPGIIREGCLVAACLFSFGLLHAGAAMAHGDAAGKIVIGFPAGQSVDTVARWLAPKLESALGRPMVVLNMPGQGGSVALAAFAKLPPDGSALTLAASAALAGNSALYKNVKYDPLKDFEPIGLLYDAPLLLLVNSALPINSVAELLSYARANPTKLSYSSPGNGTVSHLAMSEFMRRTGINMTHIPYQGSAKSLTDLAGGIVQVSFDAIAGAQPFLASGRVKAIAISSKERVSLMPDVPTVAESGVPGFDLVPWVGMLAPAGTSKESIDRVSAELARIVRSDEFVRRLASLGARPRSSSPAEFRTYLRSEVDRWAMVIKNSGAKLE